MGEKAFTLIEVLLVLTLFAAMGILSSVALSRTINQNAVINTRDYLKNTLNKAQTYAMTGRNNGNWGVHLGGTTITMFQGSTFAGRTTALDENYTVNSNISISGLTDIIFTKTTGKPNSAATITITAFGNSKTINVNSEGTVNAN